jgi:hypothetical protein
MMVSGDEEFNGRRKNVILRYVLKTAGALPTLGHDEAW